MNRVEANRRDKSSKAIRERGKSMQVRDKGQPLQMAWIQRRPLRGVTV